MEDASHRARRLRSTRIQFALTMAAVVVALLVAMTRPVWSDDQPAAAAEGAQVPSSAPAAPSASTSSAAPRSSSAAPASPSSSSASSRPAASSSESSDASAEELPNVAEGDSGEVVSVIQRAFGMEPTGYFRPATRAQVEQFQADSGIPVTGTIAELTWSALGEQTRSAALTAYAQADGFLNGEPPVDAGPTPASDESATDGEAVPAPSGSSGQPSAARSQSGAKPPVLEETDSGQSIVVLQQALGVKPASGYFGPVTTKAVQRFQASVGLPTTGVVATYTWRALGPDLAAKVASAHANYGTDFGPGLPDEAPSRPHRGNGGGNGGSSNGGGGGNSTGGRFCPVNNFSYGDGMGADRGDHSHQGLDLMGSRGEPIYAIDSGTVTRAEWQGNGALVVDITGGNGMFFYGHFDSIEVSYGEQVRAGQVIGYMGDTGSPGAVHLHLEDRPYGWSGGAVDPVPLVHTLCD